MGDFQKGTHNQKIDKYLKSARRKMMVIVKKSGAKNRTSRVPGKSLEANVLELEFYVRLR